MTSNTQLNAARGSSHARMTGRVAVVTGAGSGIGRAAAVAFGREGARVVVAGRRVSEIEETAEMILDQGGEAFAIATDVSVDSQVAHLIAATTRRYGRVDAAFNNAGIEGVFAPITDLTEADFDRVIDINLRGVWLSIKHEMAAMIAAGHGGAIVNTSSFLARGAVVGSSAYSASKGALEAMVRALALEGGPHGIRVNNVLPGVINTPMFDRLGGASSADAIVNHTPLRRLGEPADVGDVAVWLSTDEARFVTGQSLLVDGGFTIPGMR
jgi:NAD(P)-dependent dehydrogenase (short-subunit alcohol dehydrogenase family)